MIEITSDLDTAGRNFSCTGEIVTYTCSALGNILSIGSPPLFSQYTFISSDPVPGAVSTDPNAILTLINRVTNSSGTFYTANLQLTVPSDAQQMRINVSCSTNNMNNVVIPLIHECKFLLNCNIIVIFPYIQQKLNHLPL